MALIVAGSWNCTVTSGNGNPPNNGSGGSSSGSGGSSSGSGGSSSGSGGSTDSGSGGSTSTGGMTGSGSGGRNEGVGAYTGGPCDIYEKDGGPCVAAHSTVRALYANYSDHLYQVKKTADGSTKDIKPMSPGGLANSADQESFCGVDACTISIIYDQSGNGNDLTSAPAGMAKPTPDNEASAKGVSIMVGTNKVYGVHIVAGVGYRNNSPKGTATGDDPETEYMVVAGDYYNMNCCMDYGNMETTSRDDGEGTMEAVYFGNCTTWNKGDGLGPWVMGDLENGLWAGDTSPYANNKTITNWPFVTGMVKGGDAGKNLWSIKEANATSGELITVFSGHRPSSRYIPMKKQGAIGLGTGGDNSAGARGNWFEGIMTAKYSSDGADDAVQANIVSIYGQHQ